VRSIFSGIMLIVHPPALSRRGFVHGRLGQRRGGVPLRLNLQIFEQQPGGNAGRLEDDRQAAAGVGATANQVNAVQVFKALDCAPC
jgi:hypothetical protein